MIDLTKSVVDFFLHPINLFWVLVFFYFITKTRQYKHHTKFLYTALAWIFVTGTTFIPDLLIHGLEKKYNTFIFDSDSLEDETHIHVLGSGSTYDLDIAPQERLSLHSLARMSEGIRIYKKMKCARLIFSGYSSTNSVTQASITKDAAIALGIPVEDIIIFETPSTTEEEAKAYKYAMSDSKARLILVTSDCHMPRSMFLFRKLGLKPIAAPADQILKRQYEKNNVQPNQHNSKLSYHFDQFWWESNRSNFDKFHAAMHEYIGLIWAKF